MLNSHRISKPSVSTRRRSTLLILGLLLIGSVSGAFGCTIIMAARNGLVLVGNNEDFRAFFEKSNFPALERARFPVADRSGASMVVEYGQGRVRFVRSDTWYQIATNFVMSNVEDGVYPCWRYRAADKILSVAKELSLGLIRRVLDETHQEGGSLTVYSNIYDLKKGVIYIYNLRNFEEVVVMNLTEELKKGQRHLELSSLFKGD